MVLKAQLLVALFISPKWSVASRCKHFLADRSHWSCLFWLVFAQTYRPYVPIYLHSFSEEKGENYQCWFFPYFWLIGRHGSRCYIFIKQIFFCSYVLQARSLGSWSKVISLALLTFIRAYRNPPGSKDLRSVLLLLPKTLPKHSAHSHMPRMQHQRVISSNLELLFPIHLFWVLTRLGPWAVCHFDPSDDWLEIHCGLTRTGLLPGPKAHLLWSWLM